MTRARPGRHRAGAVRTGVRRAVIVTVLPLLALTAGTALAAWLSSGPGTASSKASVAKPPTTTAVSASALTTGLLYPGGTGDAVIIVNNPNPYPATVASLTTTGAASVTVAGSGACSTTGVTITTGTPSATTIPANGSATLTLSGAAAMSNASDTGCQGAVFGVPVTVAITSAGS